MNRGMPTYILIMLFLLPAVCGATSDHSHKSEYAGQEQREIKSLSASDIAELRNGSGWGLAKAAELNGVPGPIHVLEMKTEIQLTAKQVQDIEAVYRKMNKRAITLGLQLIELEKELNTLFANRSVTDDSLKRLLEKISDTYKALRYTHLAAHLETPRILTPHQIVRYNQLRGYTETDPCENIPEGHNKEMWKRHHDCP